MFKRFGESKANKLDKWYELESGERIPCDEETVNILWCNWVASHNSKRADTNEYVVFDFIKPVELDLTTAERW